MSMMSKAVAPACPFYPRIGKRIMDIALSGIGLVLVSPLLGVIGAMVRIRLGSPVLFRQVRPGIHGRPFMLLKFRTMVDRRDEDGRPLPDAERMNPLGRWMRRWSIDELAELCNVLTGDMSLVGPRPLLTRYLERYTPEQARRHEVKPGLTGWAQVNGRNAITWEEKFKLDVWYVVNRSFALDMKILAITAWKVLKREGISAEGEVTMPEFMGTVSARGKTDNV